MAYLRCVLHVGIRSFELSVQNSVRLLGWSKWKLKIVLVRIPISFGKWEIDSKSNPLICCAIRNMFSSCVFASYPLVSQTRSTFTKKIWKAPTVYFCFFFSLRGIVGRIICLWLCRVESYVFSQGIIKMFKIKCALVNTGSIKTWLHWLTCKLKSAWLCPNEVGQSVVANEAANLMY